MKAICVVALLTAALVLCGALSPPAVIPCHGVSNAAAAQLAVQAILDNHEHGYKFKLHQIQGSTIHQVQDGCEMNLRIELNETKCTVTNPKHVDDCDIRQSSETPVVANCTVMLDFKNSGVKVTRYECDTRKEPIDLHRICPDCPVLVPLNSPEGLKAVHDAIQQFNRNTSNSNIYVLHEVGRIISYYMMMTGMMYSPSFTLVETRCPMGTRIVPESCVPLCPKRAKHAYCKARYSTINGLQGMDCEFYPAEDNQVLAPGEMEPVCAHPHTGPPAPNGPPGPPGPPGSIPPSRPHYHSHIPCREAKPDSQRDIHPICNWPVEQMLLTQLKTGVKSK
ncbi:alpha-2-HS-glycoprotein 1 [Neosynchiropus ocellatus]